MATTTTTVNRYQPRELLAALTLYYALRQCDVDRFLAWCDANPETYTEYVNYGPDDLTARRATGFALSQWAWSGDLPPERGWAQTADRNMCIAVYDRAPMPTETAERWQRELGDADIALWAEYSDGLKLLVADEPISAEEVEALLGIPAEATCWFNHGGTVPARSVCDEARRRLLGQAFFAGMGLRV